MENFNWPNIILSLLLTLFFYGIFPLLFAVLRRKPITRKKYRIICFIVNFFVMILFLVVNGKSNGGPYLIWTLVFTSLGAYILERNGMLIV